MSSQFVNKAFVTKEVAGVKTSTTIEATVPLTRKAMHSYAIGLDPLYKVRRMWMGKIGEGRVGKLQETKSNLVQALCKTGGYKEADKVMKDMVVF